MNRIQRMRKDAGFDYTDRIAIWIDGPPELREAATAHAAEIRRETLARGLAVGERCAAPDLQQEHDIDGIPALLAVRRQAAG